MTDLNVDVCGTGASGNARYYAQSTANHPQNITDAAPQLNPFMVARSSALANPSPFSIANLFRPAPNLSSSPNHNSQLGLVLHHQQLDRQRQQRIEDQVRHQQQLLEQQQQQLKASETLSLHQPKTPRYSDYETRLKSFEDQRWPSDCPVSVHDLAEAGFFYYGEIQGKDRRYFDAVECFFCGKGVCRWVSGDDAWSEHRRVSPNCLFVLDVKNQIRRGEIKFVNHNVKTSSPPSSTASQCSTMSSQSSSTASSQPGSSYASDDEGYSSQNYPENPAKCSKCNQCNQCKVCLQNEISVTFLPCSHCVSCINCAPFLRTCPICRATINGSIRSYLS